MPPAILDSTFIQDLFRHRDELDQHLIEHPKTGMLMVLVPAGKFLTNTGGGIAIELDLPEYDVAVHPVTNAQYAHFVAETGHRPPDNQIWQDSGTTKHPVTNVSWEDATAYCGWAELRLPTLLEWGKAACGLDGHAYPWGKDWDKNRCRNGRNQGVETTVGVWRYGQGGSPFGGLQFSGNVWEWCTDWDGPSRVVRGGSWKDLVADSFSAYNRGRNGQDRLNDNSGFRCVRGMSASP